MFKIVIIY